MASSLTKTYMQIDSNPDIALPFGSHYGNIGCVRLIGKKRIREFMKGHPKAAEPLRHWANAVEKSTCKNPAELKNSFGSADFVRDLTVFDIGGNKFRLIAFVHYRRAIVYIKQILAHREYDKGVWKR